MRHKRVPTNLLPPTIVTTLLAIFLNAAVVSAIQDPTGRPEGSNPKRKKPVTKEKTRPAIEPPSVMLTILSEPGTDVYINSEKKGVTDAEGKLVITKLPLGNYAVEVKKDGYMSSLRAFRAGVEPPTLQFRLNPALDPI